MDTEISELGSGVESADCLVWRTAHQLSVRKEKQEWICSKADHFRFRSIPSAFVLLPEFTLFQRSGVGSVHEKRNQYNVLFVVQKIKEIV